MSASIMWAPPARGKDVPVGAPSTFIGQIEDAFGIFPVELNTMSIPVLRGMRAGGSEKRAIDELVEAIEKHGEIKVWAEY